LIEGWIATVLIALSLSMDATAVAVAAGISGKNLKRAYILRASFAFGFFQFAMPCIGWFLGESLASYIAAYDHWVAFGLLFAIGAKMALDGARNKEQSAADISNLKTLLAVATATSIDALAVGVSLSMIGGGILSAAIIFGVITFGLSLAGFEFGKALGARFERSALIIGGLVLIAIGVKTLFDHMS
jgi:putative Mn2+ efflux pump MntP